MAASVKTLTAANSTRWERAKIKAGSKRLFASVAKRLVAAKDRYRAIEDTTGVPWFVIAVIHEREASQRWDRSIAQGDPWNRKSTHVPKGRGPFKSFEAAAVDALKNCAPYAARWKDWSPGGTMTLLEKYNGLGYAGKGLPSPYIWSGTDQYVKGKYVADGVYDPNEVDQQLGCAGLILAMQQLDPSISFEGEAVATAELPSWLTNKKNEVQVASADNSFVPEMQSADNSTVEIPTEEQTWEIKQKLDFLGYHEVGTTSRAWNSKTAGAITNYKLDVGLSGPPVIDDELITSIDKTMADKIAGKWSRPISPERANVTEKDLAPTIPAVKQSILQRFYAKIVALGAMVVAAFQAIADQFHATKDYIAPYMSWFGDIPPWLWLVGIAGVAALIALNSNKISESIVCLKQTNRLN